MDLEWWDRIQREVHQFDAIWAFNPLVCDHANDGISLEEAFFEWECFLENWSQKTLIDVRFELPMV